MNVITDRARRWLGIRRVMSNRSCMCIAPGDNEAKPYTTRKCKTQEYGRSSGASLWECVNSWPAAPKARRTEKIKHKSPEERRESTFVFLFLNTHKDNEYTTTEEHDRLLLPLFLFTTLPHKTAISQQRRAKVVTIFSSLSNARSDRYITEEQEGMLSLLSSSSLTT